jgi:hypothetical protein
MRVTRCSLEPLSVLLCPQADPPLLQTVLTLALVVLGFGERAKYGQNVSLVPSQIEMTRATLHLLPARHNYPLSVEPGIF